MNSSSLRRPIQRGISHTTLFCVLVFVGVSVVACGGSGQSQKPAAVAATITPKAASTSPQATYLAPARVRDHAATILKAAINHYAKAFAEGQAIIGTAQYPNAAGGLTAMQDPNSAASRFSAWRASSRIEEDVSTYENAFRTADALFNASDEPSSISQWMQDTGTVQADISQWVQVATSYQISSVSQSALNAAATTVQAAIKTARRDVILVRQGK